MQVSSGLKNQSDDDEQERNFLKWQRSQTLYELNLMEYLQSILKRKGDQ